MRMTKGIIVDVDWSEESGRREEARVLHRKANSMYAKFCQTGNLDDYWNWIEAQELANKQPPPYPL